MEYIVKCRFCGVTYFVNSSSSNARFSCETCGAINGMDDIVEKITAQSKTVMDGDDEDIHFEYYLKIAEQGDAKAQAKLIECTNVM